MLRTMLRKLGKQDKNRVGLVLAILLVVLFVAIELGPGSLDPTDSSNFATIEIQNDLREAVIVEWVNTCFMHEKECERNWQMESGSVIEDKVSSNDSNTYRVKKTANNSILGCLYVKTQDTSKKITIRTSEKRPCAS